MSPSAIPAEERQINLLLALRNTVVGLTAAEVITTVSGYDPSGGPSARRMFERDKGVLRELGISVRTSGAEEACRYRIAEEDYALPDLVLTAAQAAAIDLAASAWRTGELTASARHALTKIRAVAQASPASAGPAMPDLTIDLAGQEIPALLTAAVDERRRVAFDYASASSGRTASRTVEPHVLRMSEGAWYLDAYEPAAGQRRTFRLARITGPISVVSAPHAFDPAPRDGAETAQMALLALAPGRGLELRSRALPVAPAEGAGAASGVEALAGRTAADAAAALADLPRGWDLVAVPYTDRFSFAGSLAALGSGVVVLAPAPMREDVLDHLRGAAALESDPTPRGA